MIRAILIALLLAGSFAVPVAHAETARVLPSDPVHPFANVAALSGNAAKRLKDGDLVETACCRTQASAGGAKYVYHATGRSGVTTSTYGALIDGPRSDDYFEIADKEDARDVRVWGCLADDTDCTTELTACIAYWIAEGDRQDVWFRGDFTFDPQSLGMPTTGNDGITWRINGRITPTDTIIVNKFLNIVGDGGNRAESTQFSRSGGARIVGLTSEQPTILVKGTSGPKLIKNIGVHGAWLGIQVGDGEETNSEALCTLDSVDISAGDVSGGSCLLVDSWFWMWAKNCTFNAPYAANTATITITHSNENPSSYTGIIEFVDCVASFQPIFIGGGAGTTDMYSIAFRNFDHEDLGSGDDLFNIDTSSYNIYNLVFDNCGSHDSDLGTDSYFFNISGDNRVSVANLSVKNGLTYRNDRYPDWGRSVVAPSFNYLRMNAFVGAQSYEMTGDYRGILKGRLLSSGQSSPLPMGVADGLTTSAPPSSLTDHTVTDATYWDGTTTAKKYVSTDTEASIVDSNTTASTTFADGDFYVAVTMVKRLGSNGGVPPIRLALKPASGDYTKLTGDIDSAAGVGGAERVFSNGWECHFSAFRMDEATTVNAIVQRRFNPANAVGCLLGPTVHGKLAVADGWTVDDVLRLGESGWLTDAPPGVIAAMAHQAIRPGVAATGDLPSASDRGEGAIMYDSTLGSLVVSDGDSWQAPAADATSFSYAGRPPQLHKWFEGGLSGKKIVMVGDSTTDGVIGAGGALYTRLAYWQSNGCVTGGPIAGTTVVDRGYNGATAYSFNNGVGLPAAIADDGDLYVYCFGINDVRLGDCDKETLKDRIRTSINAIRAAVPQACFVLRMPNPLWNKDGQIYIDPGEEYDTYSYIMRDAYMELANEWPDAVMLDTWRVFGPPVDGENPLLYDALHPEQNALRATVDDLVKMIGDFGQQYFLPGSDQAEGDDYEDAYTIYPPILDGSPRFEKLAEGTVTTNGGTYFDLNLEKWWQQDYKLDRVIIWQDGLTPFKTGTNGVNTGGAAAYTRWGEAPGETLVAGRRVRVYRDRMHGDKSLGTAMNKQDTYPYRVYVSVTSGTNYIDIQALDPSDRGKLGLITTSDILHTQGQTALTLSGFTFSMTNDLRVRCSKTGDFSAYNGLRGYVFGTAAREAPLLSNVGAPRDGHLWVADDAIKVRLDGGTHNLLSVTPEEVTGASPALVASVASNLDSTSNAITATLGSGDYVGQVKTIVMTNASNSSTVSVTNHVTSDPEVFTFDAVDEYLVLMWTGTEWVTVAGDATTAILNPWYGTLAAAEHPATYLEAVPCLAA